MSKEEFEALVVAALNQIPSSFKEKLDNVDIVVEDWPSREQAMGRLLLGLYQGVPQTARGRGYTLVPPDKITIFQKPIELVAHNDSDKIKETVVDTVEHEIAHHFGISDERLLELKRSKV